MWLILFLMLGGSCTPVAYETEGIVLKHVKDSPYPFQSKLCPSTMWLSKLVIDEMYEDEKYRGYMTADTQCYDALGSWLDCSTIREGQAVYIQAIQKEGKNRGNLVTVRLEN